MKVDPNVVFINNNKLSEASSVADTKLNGDSSSHVLVPDSTSSHLHGCASKRAPTTSVVLYENMSLAWSVAGRGTERSRRQASEAARKAPNSIRHPARHHQVGGVAMQKRGEEQTLQRGRERSVRLASHHRVQLARGWAVVVSTVD